MYETCEIIESFTKGKQENRNEDGIYIGESFVAVIDGATSKDDFLFRGKTGGQIARDSIIQSLSSLKGDEDMKTVVKTIQGNLVNYAMENAIPRMSAVAVIKFSGGGNPQACLWEETTIVLPISSLFYEIIPVLLY